MDTSLVVAQQRHLSLPDSCLFRPSELHIFPDCSVEDFERIVKAVVMLDQAEDLWVADASLHAFKTWKKEGLAIAAKAFGLSVPHLYKSALVARDFPPEHRWLGYAFSHYRVMQAFPRDWSYAFLERHAGEKHGMNSLRALAEREFGGNPAKARQPKKRSVLIRAELYARLRPHADNRKVHFLIERILEDWLRVQPDVPIPVIIESAAARYKREVFERRAEKHKLQEEKAAAVLAKRATYAERRKQQIADGAKQIPAKEKKASKIRIAWTGCAGEQLIDSENGPVHYKGPCGSKPTKFYSEADALAAEAEHFEARGYHEQVKQCDVCSGGNARKECWHVYHIYRTELEGKRLTR